MKKYPTTKNTSIRTLNTGTKSSEDHQLTKIGVLKQNHRIFKRLRWINLDEPLTFHIVTLYKNCLIIESVKLNRFSLLNSYIFTGDVGGVDQVLPDSITLKTR